MRTVEVVINLDPDGGLNSLAISHRLDSLLIVLALGLFDIILSRSVVYGGPGGAMPWQPQILADQLTLSQPRGADYAHQIILAPPDFRTFLRPCNLSNAGMYRGVTVLRQAF